jgi:hypothetical protein
MKNEENNNEGQERREFLKKVGIGGAAALAGGAVLGAPTASAATDKKKGADLVPFKTKTISSNLKSEAETSNKFIIDVQDWVLDDAALAKISNALVATAVDNVRRLGKATPLNTAATMQSFGQFGSFNSFGSFGSFSSGSELIEGPQG